ncbi:MAG: hypothetical protein ACREBV_01965, partial [Candidatus Zixiibacteriota bacterium]
MRDSIGLRQICILLASLLTVLTFTHGRALAQFTSTWEGSSGDTPDSICPNWIFFNFSAGPLPSLTDSSILINTSTNSRNQWYVMT